MTEQQKENLKKLAIIAQAYNVEPEPTEPPKPGYKWQATHNGPGVITWVLEPDPDAVGTMTNPHLWKSGLTVEYAHHYSYEGNTYLCFGEGSFEEFPAEIMELI